MEAENIFPVFSQLHTDAPSIPVFPVPRTVCPNDAGLFVVSKQGPPVAQPEQSEADPLRVTGDTKADLVTALRALAFLMSFLEAIGPEELRRTADDIEASEVRL